MWAPYNGLVRSTTASALVFSQDALPRCFSSIDANGLVDAGYEIDEELLL